MRKWTRRCPHKTFPAHYHQLLRLLESSPPGRTSSRKTGEKTFGLVFQKYAPPSRADLFYSIKQTSAVGNENGSNVYFWFEHLGADSTRLINDLLIRIHAVTAHVAHRFVTANADLQRKRESKTCVGAVSSAPWSTETWHLLVTTSFLVIPVFSENVNLQNQSTGLWIRWHHASVSFLLVDVIWPNNTRRQHASSHHILTPSANSRGPLQTESLNCSIASELFVHNNMTLHFLLAFWLFTVSTFASEAPLGHMTTMLWFVISD